MCYFYCSVIFFFFSETKLLLTESMKHFIQQKEKFTPHKFKRKSNKPPPPIISLFQTAKHTKCISSAVVGVRRQEGIC